MGKNILFKLSGSIAAYKSCELISKLIQKGFNVQVVATSSALKFVGTAMLEGLTRRPVLTETFSDGQMMSHIELNRWADLTILCPATGNIINEMAAGISENLATTLFLAHDFAKPYLIAPAMNEKMYQHPATQVSLKKLSEWGVTVLPVESGYLGCGDVGEGRLLNTASIFHAILSKLRNETNCIGRILVTSGGTQEPIDEVRAITNFSSGKTGAQIAEAFFYMGYDVTYIHGHGAALPDIPSKNVEFKSFADLESVMQKELMHSSSDIFVHSAAVGDFFVKQASSGKIESGHALKLELGCNAKLLNRIKKWSSNSQLILVGFKLTVRASDDVKKMSVERIIKESNCDFVVSNDLSEINDQKHAGQIWSKVNGSIDLCGKFSSKTQLADNLLRVIQEKRLNMKMHGSSNAHDQELGGVEI